MTTPTDHNPYHNEKHIDEKMEDTAVSNMFANAASATGLFP
jgi:hypothetical protein